MKTRSLFATIGMSLLLNFQAICQVVTIGTDVIKTKPGTSLSIGSLLLQVSDTFVLSNTSVRDTTNPVSVNGTGSIEDVFTFSSPVSFTGTATLAYTVPGLNGNPAADLVIAYNSTSGGMFTLDCGSTADTTNQKVISSALSSATLYELTAVRSTFTVAAITGTATVCAGNNTALANSTPGGAWSSGATSIATVDGTGTVYGVAAGTAVISYSVTNGCHTVIATITVTVNANPSVSATSTGVSCHGDTNGSITTSVTGGSGTYSYTWSGGASGANPTGLAPGVYSVTVTDANGCQGNASATVSEPATLIATAVAAPVSCYGSSTGSVVVSATGGTAPYTGTGTFTGLSAGTYSYTVTDAHGCTAIVSATVTPAPAFTVTASISPIYTVAGQAAHTIFLGYGPSTVTVTATPSGGTPGYTYSWSPAASCATPLAAATAISPTVTTTYTVTVTDANGCTATAVATEHVLDVRCCSGHSGHCEKVKVCHNGRTLCISSSAVAAHLGHSGDYLGECGGGKPGQADESTIVTGNDEISVFPNPNDGSFSVLIPADHKEATVTVSDLTGKTIASRYLADNDGTPLQFGLTNAAPGMYFVKVNAGDNSAVIKIVKQ